MNLLVFRLQEAQACIELRHVEQVLALMALHPLPGAGPDVVGLLDLHGRSLVVVDLGMRLGLPRPEPYHADTPVVICNAGEGRAGLVVNEILGVMTAEASAVQPTGALAGKILGVEGILRTEQGLALLLDPHQLLAVHSELIAPTDSPADA